MIVSCLDAVLNITNIDVVYTNIKKIQNKGLFLHLKSKTILFEKLSLKLSAFLIIYLLREVFFKISFYSLI